MHQDRRHGAVTGTVGLWRGCPQALLRVAALSLSLVPKAASASPVPCRPAPWSSLPSCVSASLLASACHVASDWHHVVAGEPSSSALLLLHLGRALDHRCHHAQLREKMYPGHPTLPLPQYQKQGGCCPRPRLIPPLLPRHPLPPPSSRLIAPPCNPRAPQTCRPHSPVDVPASALSR